jgi:hypothetical protein
MDFRGGLMKQLAGIVAALVTVAGCDTDNPASPSGNTGSIVFTAQLSPASEVPRVANDEASGSGTATITFNVGRDAATGNIVGGGAVNFSVQLSGFPAGTVIRAAHIHPGAAGAVGDPLIDTGLTPATAVTLTNGSGTLTLNNVALDQADAQAIAANPAGFYFNVHSTLNPAGVARGQLVRR